MSVVKWFNTYLKECLNKKSVSIKMLCDETGLNYTKMLKIVKGECKCSQGELDIILGSKYLTGDEKTYIRGSFEYININSIEKKEILEIEDVLKNLYETVIERATLTKNLLEAKGEENEISKLSTQVNDQLYKSYTSTLKDVFMEGSGIFSIVLYLPAVPALINEIFHTIRALKACLDKRIVLDITCVVDESGHKTESYFHRYSHFLKYIKMATLSEHITMKVMQKNDLAIEYGMYFVDRTVLINAKNLEVTILHTNMLSKFDDAILERSPLVRTRFSKDSLIEYMETLLKEKNGKTKRYSVMNNLNPSFIGRSFIDNFNETCHDDACKKIIEVYYRNELNKLKTMKHEHVNFICESGLELLLAEGVMPDYSAILSPIDDYSRLALVYDTLERMICGCKIRILPKDLKKSYPHIGVVQYFEIHKTDDAIILKGHKKSSGYVQTSSVVSSDRNYEFIIRDEKAILAFDLFCSKVMKHISIDEDQSFKIIKNIAINNYTKHKNPKILALVNEISKMELI